MTHMSFTSAYPPLVSTPQDRSSGPATTIGRAAFLLAAVIFVISSTAAVAGLEDLPEPRSTALAATPTTVAAAVTAQLTGFEAPIDPNQCDPLIADACDEPVTPAPIPVLDVDTITACATGQDQAPSGVFAIVPGTAGDPASDNTVRLRVEVEEGLAVDPVCFAETALAILSDERGWGSIDNIDFARVDDDSYDLRLILASPAATDTHCYPARTAGRYSCRNGEKVIINLMRWNSGTDDYADDLTTYRHYLLNHEVGHFLGRGHLTCQVPGAPAPVMMQQTKGLGDCLPNGWPTEVER